MISMDDFKKEDGNIDWKAYREAQINAGEKCYRCEQYIPSYFGTPKPYRHLCNDCEELDTNHDEVNHDNLIRCPKCKHTFSIQDIEAWECYEDGEHDLNCPECEHEFRIETSVSYSFTSPELIPEPPEPEDEEKKEE
jgi:uncharacterized C2H2 Zn-finger protein